MEIDLNNPAIQDDDNPKGEFIELNDILAGNNVVEEVINNVLPPPVPEEQQFFHLADEYTSMNLLC
jgi:hypothetical protein